jgi:CheY-like chemotaxis protein
MGDALHASDRAAELTRQLLTYGRKQIMAPSVLSAESVLTKIRSMLQQLAGKSIAVEIVVSNDAGNIYADRSQLEQMLVNLTINACDSMPEGGRLTIEATSCTVTEELCRRHAGSVPGDYLCLSVADRGHGMSPETVQSIFEPFFTTKEVGSGTGLGLAVVDGVVSQHGGFIEVSSRLDEGTTFEIYLPQVGPEAGPPSQEGYATAPPSDNRGYETVAILEPDAALRRTAGNVLRALGYGVLEAEDGQRMSSLAAAHSSELHLLVVGARISDGDREALVQELTRERRRLRVLVAGAARNDDRVPVSLPERYAADELAASVRQALDGGSSA